MEDSSKKDKFLIFLDFDGVLNDIKSVSHLLKMGGFFVREDDDNVFCKDSINAINYLIETMSLKYDVQLVLTTFWKCFPKAVNILKNNGLIYSGKINSTPIFFGQRKAKEIIHYLIENDEWKEFLIIDDKSSLKKCFSEKNFIKTNIWDGALTISDVLNYLKTYYPDLEKQNPIKDNFMYGSNEEKCM